MNDLQTIYSALGIVATIVGTTFFMAGKLARLEVMIAELRANIAHFETRLQQLERRNERP